MACLSKGRHGHVTRCGTRASSLIHGAVKTKLEASHEDSAKFLSSGKSRCFPDFLWRGSEKIKRTVLAVFCVLQHVHTLCMCARARVCTCACICTCVHVRVHVHVRVVCVCVCHSLHSEVKGQLVEVHLLPFQAIRLGSNVCYPLSQLAGSPKPYFGGRSVCYRWYTTYVNLLFVLSNDFK